MPHAPRLTTLILLAGISTLTLNMFLPSLPAIAAEFGVSYGRVSLTVGLYLACAAVLQLVIGPLSDRLGRRPVLLTALSVFTLASVGCALATSFPVFLGFRLVQGTAVAGYVLAMAIVRDTRAASEATAMIGTINMVMAIAPMTGPMIGGVLDAGLGWRAIFWAYALAGGCLLVLSLRDVRETRIVAEGQSVRPREILSEPLFWGYAGCLALSVGAFYVFLAGAPLIAAKVFGIGPAEVGVFLGSITMGFMAGSYLSRRLAANRPPWAVMLMGRVVATVGLSIGFLLALFLPPSLWITFGATLSVGFGNGIGVPGNSAGAMSVRPDLAGSASGMMGALTVAGGALATTLAAPIVTAAPAPATLIGLMLGLTALGLLLALWVARAEQKRARVDA